MNSFLSIKRFFNSWNLSAKVIIRETCSGLSFPVTQNPHSHFSSYFYIHLSLHNFILTRQSTKYYQQKNLWLWLLQNARRSLNNVPEVSNRPRVNYDWDRCWWFLILYTTFCEMKSSVTVNERNVLKVIERRSLSIQGNVVQVFSLISTEILIIISSECFKSHFEVSGIVSY